MIALPSISKKKLAGMPRDQLIQIYLHLSELEKRVNSKSKGYQKKYYNDPLQWVLDFVDITLPDYDQDILRMIKAGEKKVAVFGPHGLGKSVLAAVLLLWAGSVSPDCKVITTASAWRQLEEYLWPEVHKWYFKVNWLKIESISGIREPRLLTLECQFCGQSKAFAVASDNPATIEGAHAQRIVYIFDEAKAIPAGTWESAEGAFSTPGDHLQFAFSTPGDVSGTFYSICSRQKGYERWKVRHVSLREAIRAKRITLEWAREKRDAWGATNPVYINRVAGMFAKDSDSSVIPFSWVNAAVNRWNAWKSAGGKLAFPLSAIGADTAGQGVDKCCFYFRYAHILSHCVRYNKSKPMELAGKLKVFAEGQSIINIDTSYGEGAGTADRLSEFPEMNDRVHCINFGAKTTRTDKSGLIGFVNTRACMWWSMREQLDPDNGSEIMLPDDPILIGDLTAPKRVMRSDGKILIESKEDIKKRIGRSTDDGDACCLAFWRPDSIALPGLYVIG